MRECEVDWTPIADIKPARHGRGYSTFSREEGERIRRFWMEKQIPAIWIGRYFGVNNCIIGNVVNRKTKFYRPAVRLMTEQQIRDAWERYSKGTPIKHVARELGTTYYGITYQFEKLGLPLVKQPSVMQTHVPQVAELTRKGHSVQDIARIMGVSKGTVTYCREKIRRNIERLENGTDN